MDQLIVALIVGLAILLILGYGYWRQRQATARSRWEKQEQRPALLRNARLLLSEQPIRCKRPVPLHGRVDQVYQLANGELCVVDSKARRLPRVYPSDVIQASVYATILRAKGYTVHDKGYVRQTWRDHVRYLPFDLLSDEKIVALYHYRKELLANPSVARVSVHPALCKGCGHRERGRCEGRA